MLKNKEQTLSLWVQEFSDALYTWAFHKTNNKEAAEDLVQDTFLAAFRHLDSFREESSPKTWLFRILNNKIIDFYRKKAKNINMQAYSLDAFFKEDETWQTEAGKIAWGEKEENLLDNEEFALVLEKCLQKLSEQWLWIIQSKFLLEKSAEEICQELDISASNYWQIVHRAKLALRSCIGKNWR
jgi:RNA polymerase sigma-70 factor (ECF subfamily)